MIQTTLSEKSFPLIIEEIRRESEKQNKSIGFKPTHIIYRPYDMDINTIHRIMESVK
jgi:hypothetical protein